MKHIKFFPFLFVLFLSALSYSSAQASVDIVNLSTQATGANPFVLAVGPNNTVITVGYSCDCLKIHDVSNKTSPVLKSTASTNSQPGFVVVSGNYAYITTYLGKVETWDISSSTAPTRTNVYSFGGAYGAAKERIANGYLYMTTWQSGFAGPGGVAIFDLSSSSAPTLVSNTSYSVNQSGTGDVLPIGNYLYAEDYFGKTIKVYDITNKAAPALRQSIAARSENGVSYKTNQFEPWRLLNKGNALYVMDDDIIEVYDISSSTNMVYSTTTVAGRDIEGAEIRGDLLYYSSSGVDTPATNKKIQIFNIKNPFAPVEVASKINGYNNYWLVIDNSGYYYTTMASDALIIVLSNHQLFQQHHQQTSHHLQLLSMQV